MVYSEVEQIMGTDAYREVRILLYPAGDSTAWSVVARVHTGRSNRDRLLARGSLDVTTGEDTIGALLLAISDALPLIAGALSAPPGP